MTHFTPQQALHQPRQLGIRIRLGPAATTPPNGELDTLQTLLNRHGVICLAEQRLSPRELQAFASSWGEIIRLPAGLAFSNQEPGLPAIARVGNVRADGSIIPGARYGEYWHHDGDFWPPGEHFVINFLLGVHIPEAGGNTGFWDARLAYERLSDELREALDGASIVVKASDISDFRDAKAIDLPPDARHAVFQVHPIDGTVALYLPDAPDGIQARTGEPFGAVADLLAALQRRQGIYEHCWREGDLLIIDNLQVMHRSMGRFGDHPRLLHRCQCRVR